MNAIRNISAVRARLHEQDVAAARDLARLAKRRKPRPQGTGPHIIDPQARAKRA